MNLRDYCFTSEWTLFLDRDGVISRRLPDDYIKQWEEFSFLEGVFEAIRICSGIFGRIIVVSNQQGVGKGLMERDILDMVDRRMREDIQRKGGRIDAAYYATSLESENHPDRKPGTGMGRKAKETFPEIDFSRSVMVGDSPSDIEFGKRLGMLTVFISTDNINPADADFCYRSLFDFASQLKT